ncbi:hypothetical protein BASA60_009518, partial [Batrachochytrium salamandrivorans]
MRVCCRFPPRLSCNNREQQPFVTTEKNNLLYNREEQQLRFTLTRFTSLRFFLVGGWVSEWVRTP